MKTTLNQLISCMCYGALLATFYSGYVIGGKPTNAANELYIAIPKNSFVDETTSLLVTTHDSGYVHFSVASASFYYVGGVSNGSFNRIGLPKSLELLNENDRNKGIRIHTTDRNKKISAYLLKEGRYLSGGYLALPSKPVSELIDQYTYYITSYLWDNRVDLDPYSGAVLVGCYNNTQVTIMPTQTITIPSDLQSSDNPQSSVLQGESYNVTLNALQTYDFASALDLTGTKLVSNMPITVLGYHECADIPLGVGFCDYIVEQFPPTVNWGRLFYLSSLNSRTASVRYKVIGKSSSTSTTMICTVQGQTMPEATTQSYLLSGSGEAYEFEVRENRFCSLQANKPVLVVQYSPGYSIDRTGDPFMLNIPPVEQYSNNYTLIADSSFSNHMTITVAVSYFNPESIFVDAETIANSSWTPTYCSSSVVCGYGTMFSITPGTHYVYHSDPHAEINVLVYGFEYHTAYGYLGGMQLNWIADTCQHGDVQLVPLPDSASEAAGKVEICLDGVWSNICGRGWLADDAGVVCRQLGYSAQGASAYSGLSHNRLAWPYIVSAINCNGSETQLLNCTYSTHFAECGQAEAAFAYCQPVSNLSATAEVVSNIHERSPAIISCTVFRISAISESVMINITWSKDNSQLYDNSQISIISANMTEYMYQSNLTIHVLSASDNGLYSCTAAMLLSQPPSEVVASATSSVYLELEASSSLIFQLRLVGVGQCSVWLLQFSTPAEKIMQVASAIADNTAELCEHCGLTTNHITDGAFQCFVQNAHEVTFRARLHSSPTSTPMELINHIIYWIENGASIAINGILLSVDQSCDIVIESFSEPECQREQQLITEYIETTSMPITEDGSATTGMSSSTTASFVDKTVSFTETPTVPTAFTPNVTTFISSVVLIRNPATITCIVMLTATITNDAIVDISWSKDGRQLHSNREIVITSYNASATLFQSNLTINVLEISDRGTYSCHVVLLSTSTDDPVSPPTTSTISLQVEASSNILFQLRLIGVGYCSEWLFRFSTVTERMKQVTSAIVDHTLDLCDNCGLTMNHIADGAFQCFTQAAHEVTFRAHLYATATKTPQEIITHTINWIKGGASIAISGLVLTVDSNCDVVIESFGEPECTQLLVTEPIPTAYVSTTKDVNIHNKTLADGTGQLITPTTHATTQLEQPTKNNILHFSAEIIVVGVVVVVAIFIIAVMLTVSLVVCLCFKYCRKTTDHSIPSSAVTSFPLPSYDGFPADIKTEGDETKEAPPEYPNSDLPSYYWEPISAL